MLKLFTSLITFLLFIITPTDLLAQEHEWVNRITRDYELNKYRLAADREGIVFVMGSFRGILPLGDSTFDSNSPSKHDDIFLAKYNADGQILWARQFGAYGTTPNINSWNDKFSGFDELGSLYVD